MNSQSKPTGNPVEAVAALLTQKPNDSKADKNATGKETPQDKQSQEATRKKRTTENSDQSSVNVDENNPEKAASSANENIDKDGKDSQESTQKPDESDDKNLPDDDATDETTGEDQPVTLADLAKKLEVDDADLYEVVVPLGNNKSISLGEMKDQFNAWAAKAPRLENLEHHEMQHQGEVMRTQRTIEDIVKHLPVNLITPQFKQEVAKFQQVRSGQEMDRLLTVKPEWANPAVGAAAKKGMLAAAQSYGLSQQDVDAISDHRWLVALDDLAKLKKQISEASSAAKKVVSATSKAPKQNAKAMQSGLAAKLKVKAKAGDKQAQQELVAGLLTKKG